MNSRRVALGIVASVCALVLPRLSAAAASLLPPARPDPVLSADQPLAGGNGIVAIVEGKVITYDAVRRELAGLLPAVQAQARTQNMSQKEYEDRRDALIDDIITNLIDRELIIKEFHKPLAGKVGAVRNVPDAVIDGAIAEEQASKFDNDRAKFLAWLNSNHMTLKEHRKEVEDEIVFNYMRSMQHKSQSIVSPVRIETYYNENKDRFVQADRVKIRTLQLERKPGETDGEIRARMNDIVAKFKSGTKFPDLIKAYSADGTSGAKSSDWVEKDSLLETFSKPIFALKPGDITDPILDEKGTAYLIYIDDREYAGLMPLDKVRPQIEHILVDQMSVLSTEKWLERLRRDGFIQRF